VRLAAWLVVLAYIEKASPPIRLVLVPAYVFAFCWLYAFRTSADPLRNAKLKDERAIMGVAFPAPIAAITPLLCAITALSLLSWGPVLAGACGSVDAFTRLWPPRSNLTDRGLPTVFGVILLILQTTTYPLVEEFSMRGWLLTSLRKRLGIHWSVVLVALAFAFFHLTPYPSQLVTLFLFGVILGYAVVASGSLWTAIAMHFTWNFTIALLTAPPLYTYFWHLYRTWLFRCESLRIGVVLTLLLFTAAFYVLNRRKRHAKSRLARARLEERV
jgi:membrane protease YdiL (CAAX protease family)